MKESGCRQIQPVFDVTCEPTQRGDNGTFRVLFGLGTTLSARVGITE